MKIYKIEVLLLILAAVFIVLMAAQVKAVQPLLIMTLGSLSVIYFLMAPVLADSQKMKDAEMKDLIQYYKDRDNNKGKIHMLGGWSLSILTISFLFKWMDFPGATMQTLVGMVGGLIGIAMYSFLSIKGGIEKYRKILVRLVGFMLIIGSMHLIPSEDWYSFKYPDHPEYVDAILEYEKDPSYENQMRMDSLRTLYFNQENED